MKNEIDRPKERPVGDWHKADVKAALEKRGWTLAGLSRANGYHKSAAQVALWKPWPNMERLIAHALGLTPEEIWPSRYQSRAA